MKVLIVYDTVYGNTEKVARAIGGAISGDVRVVRAEEVNPAGILPIDALIVGAPTHGGRATKPIQGLLEGIPPDTLKGVKVAAFDTRYARVRGGAADGISVSLTEKGGTLISPPTAFIVEGKKGPLREGDIERAAAWARSLLI